MANRPFDRDWDERNEQNRDWSPGRRGREREQWEQSERERGFYGRENEGASFAEQGRQRQEYPEFGADYGASGRRSYGQGAQRGQYGQQSEHGSGRSVGERSERSFGAGYEGYGERGAQGSFGFGEGFRGYGRTEGREQGPYGGQFGGWQERGRFAGRGPKGYRRSDERITDEINERLTKHPEIDATEIEVIVQNAEVTLRGNVDERQAKRLAEDIAEDVFGVSDVHNEIRVRRHEGQGLWGSLKEAFGGEEHKESGRRIETEQELTGSGKTRK